MPFLRKRSAKPASHHSDSAVKQKPFGRDHFQYDAENNVYICPQGNILTPSKNVFFKKNREDILYQGKSTVCHECPLHSLCIREKAKTKKLERWLHEEVIERHKERTQQTHA